MRGRLIEPLERWLFERAALALALAYVLRLALGYTLWGGHALDWGLALRGLLDPPLVVLLVLAAAQGLAMHCVPRAYAAAAGTVTGGLCCLATVEMLARFGWPLRWPLGHASLGWLAAAGGSVLVACGLSLWQRRRWLAELRGHGIAWTRDWAGSKPYSARKLALRALRYMGDWETV